MIKPINSYILLKIINEEEITKGGFILSSINENIIKKGLVVEVNTESKLSKRDTILFNINESQTFTYQSEVFYLIPEKQILAVIEGEKNE